MAKVEKQIGDYILEDEIGSGGFAKVVQGIHIPTGEKVAIKVLNKLQLMEDPENLKRVEREIQILKLVKHKNIIKLYEVMETPQKIYLVMELCEGGELFDYIVDKERLDENQACLFYQEIIDALDYLHSQNIVHRDIKPENMLIDIKKDKKSIKIIDFGISTSYTNESLLSTPCGTAAYAPPEMHKGEEYYGLLSDIWSSGIVLYAMVYGYLPFCEDDEEENIKNIIAGNYELEDGVSENVRDLIKHCMDIDPLERYDIEQVKKHPWFNLVTPPVLRPGVIVGYNNIPVDDRIVKLCGEYGYDQEKLKISVINNKFDRNSAIYYIMLKKLIKEGYDSVSDLYSEEYVKYISSEDNLVNNKRKEEDLTREIEKKEHEEVVDKKETIETKEQNTTEEVKEIDNGTKVKPEDIPAVPKEIEKVPEKAEKQTSEELVKIPQEKGEKGEEPQKKLMSKYAGRKSFSLQSQLHLTLQNELVSINQGKKRISNGSKKWEALENLKEKNLQNKNPKKSVNLSPIDMDNVQKIIMDSNKKEKQNKELVEDNKQKEPQIFQNEKNEEMKKEVNKYKNANHTIIHNRNASCVEIGERSENEKEKEKIRDISYSPKQTNANKKARLDKIPWKYKKMALEKITEKTKYEEYKKKLQQNLAVKTIHQYNHKNSPHKENHINNLTQFEQYDNKSCNQPNSSKSNNTSLSVSFYVNNSMIIKESDLQKTLNQSISLHLKKKQNNQISNDKPKKKILSYNNKNNTKNTTKNEEESPKKTQKKPIEKINSYIKNNLLSPSTKKKYVISTFSIHNSAIKKKQKISSDPENNTKLTQKESPRQIKGPLDITCIIESNIKELWEKVISFFKNNKISFVKIGAFKFHCSKNGSVFNVEICVIDNNKNLYYLAVKSKQQNEILQKIVQI